MLKPTGTNGFNTPSNQTVSKLNNSQPPLDKKIEETAKLNLDQQAALSRLNNNLWSKISDDKDDLFEMPSRNGSGSADNSSELGEESDDTNLVFYDLEDETHFDLEKSNEFDLDIRENSTNRELAAVNGAIEAPAKIEATKKRWWDFAGDILSKGIQTVASAAASATIKKAADNFAKNLNKGELISHARQSMMIELNDPMFVAFTDMITHLAWSAIEPKINKRSNDFLGSTLFQHQGTIKDVIEINLAQGFANFAKEIKANRGNIPNFDHQPTLVNMISVLLHRSSTHIDAAKLRTIEQKYRKSYLDILDQAKILCSNIPNYQELIKEYRQSSDPVIRQRIVQALLPGYVKERDQMSTLLLTKIDQLKNHEKELRALFDQVTDDILTELFPNKVNDLKFPGDILTYIPYLPDYVYNNYIKAPLTDLLLTTYIPLENNTLRNEGWENNLKKHIGNQDLSPIIQSPAALLLGYTTNYVQTNPNAVGMAANFLGSLMESSRREIARVVPNNYNNSNDPGENRKKNDLFSQLSQEQLANSCVESIQAMLHTEDPHLLGLGEFVKQVFNNLTLALMANGTAIVFPEGEGINEDHFLKVLLDRIVEKVKLVNADEATTDDFWKDFVGKLPLPPLIQNHLIPLLIDQTKALQEVFFETTALSGMAENPERDAVEIIRHYKGGEQILSIIDTVSNQIVESILEENIGLVEDYELGDTINEIVDEYLPGVQVNENLKNWFKSNMNAFSASLEGNSPQSIILLKNGVREIFREAIINTIETAFKDSEDYAAQLLNNIRCAFAKAFANYDENTRDAILKGQKIQAKIRKKQDQIKKLNQQIIIEPTNLTPEQTERLKDLKNARLRCQRAENYLTGLKTKLEDTLNKLNATLIDAPWNIEYFEHVSKALVLRNANLANLRTPNSRNQFIEELNDQNIHLSIQQDAASAHQLAANNVLISLLGMSSEQLVFVIDALNIEATLKHAEYEQQILDHHLEEAEREIELLNGQPMENRSDWKNALNAYVALHLKRKAIGELNQEIDSLDKQLEAYLGEFQILSEELTALLGLDQKEKLNLMPFLRDKIWPYIESAKKNQIARLLFTHITPLMLPIFDIHLNRQKLQNLSQGNDVFTQLCDTAAQGLIGRIPDFITSYKPCAETILTIMDVPHPSEAAASMETSLHNKMLELGKEGMMESMLQPMLVEYKENATVEEKNQAQVKAELISQAFVQQTKNPAFKEFTIEQVFAELQKFRVSNTNKETLRLRKQAQVLTKDLNQFLLNRGKTKLTPRDLIAAYNNQVHDTQIAVTEENIEQKIKALKVARLIERIKDVAITPEEIAQTLNDVIPGAKDLHTLIAPELQAVIVGQDPAFQENRGTMQRYAEGMLLRTFLIIAQANQMEGRDILTVLTEKLKNLELGIPELQGKNDEEIARHMIDQLIGNIIGVVSKDDFKGIPLPLQKMAYDKLKEVAYQHATPYLLLMIERKKTRAALEKASGSPFLGNVSHAISRDIFKLIPTLVSSYKPIAAEIHSLLYDQSATQVEIDQMAEKIAALVEKSDKVKLTNQAILEAFIKAEDLNAEKLKALKIKLREKGFKQKINNIIIAPEGIVTLIKESLLPQMPAQLQAALAKEIQNFTHDKPVVYKNISEFAQGYVEGVLLNAFRGMAKKNPPDQDKHKDSMLVAMEKLFDLAEIKFKEMLTRPFDEIAQAFEKEVMESIFGIDSPEAFKGLPPPLQTKIFDLLKNKLAGTLISVQQSLKNLENGSDEVQAAKAGLREDKFGPLKEGKANGEILAEDIANYALSIIPETLTEANENAKDFKIINKISKGVEGYLEDLAESDLELAKVFLDYAQAPQYQKILSEKLINIANTHQPIQNKQKAMEMVSNLIAMPLNRILQAAFKLEEQNGEEIDHQLIKTFLRVLLGHFKKINEAKEIALAGGSSQMLHADFIQVQGDQLHPAVPTKAIDYHETIEAILSRINTDGLNKAQIDSVKNNLRMSIERLVDQERKGIENLSIKNILVNISSVYKNATGQNLEKGIFESLIKPYQNGLNLKKLIRGEAEALNEQRDRYANIPGALVLLKALFPKGKDDLTFLPENQRAFAWKQLKKFFPTALPIILNAFFTSANLKKLAVLGFEAGRDTVDEKIALLDKKIPDLSNKEKSSKSSQNPLPPLDDFDILMEDIVVELLKNVKLPNMIKKQIVDPKKGVSDSMKRRMGAALREQFNGTFIRNLLPKALEGVVKRDGQGHFALQTDERPKAVKEAEAAANKKKVDDDLHKVPRQLINSLITYVTRSYWMDFQDRFDKLIEKVFGKIGANFKAFLDKIFRFIFFKIVGTILSVLLKPLKHLANEILYRVASLDENINALLNLFQAIPSDQPIDEEHGIYNDDFVYKLAQTMYTKLNVKEL